MDWIEKMIVTFKNADEAEAFLAGINDTIVHYGGYMGFDYNEVYEMIVANYPDDFTVAGEKI